MIFAGISNEPWPIPSAWRASTTTWLGLLRMRLASSRAGKHSPMRPSRIGRGGPPVLGMADWPTQTRLRRLLIRSRVSGGTTPAHVAAARSSRSAAWAESLSGRRYRACCEESAQHTGAISCFSDPFSLVTLTVLQCYNRAGSCRPCAGEVGADRGGGGAAPIHGQFSLL